MTADVENLLLEHMKRFQTSLDRVERKQDAVPPPGWDCYRPRKISSNGK